MSTSSQIKQSKVQSAKLHSWQIAAAKAFDKLEPDQVLVLKKCRQIGGSFLAQQMICAEALNHPCSYTIIVSPTSRQNQRIFREMMASIGGSKLLWKKSEVTLTFSWTNGSQTVFLSAESRESLRGYHCNLLIVDEAVTVSDDVFNLILPFTTKHHANLVLVSTPLAKRGFF